MRNRYLIHPTLALICFLASLLVNSVAMAQAPPQWMKALGVDPKLSYQATRIMETKDTRISIRERVAPNKRAMELNMGGMRGTMITREDLNKAYFTMPDVGMYREMKLGEALKQSNQHMNMENPIEVGRETISGFDATKYKTQFKDQNGKGAGYIWVADAGFPIKMDMVYQSRRNKGERMIMTLTDIELGPQSAAHFEVPPNLRPMTLGGLFSR